MTCIIVVLAICITIVVLFKIAREVPQVNLSDIFHAIKHAGSPALQLLFAILGIFQLLRYGVWAAIIAFSTGFSGVALVICDISGAEAVIKLGRYILCSIFEALERIKPTGRPLPPFCQ